MARTTATVPDSRPRRQRETGTADEDDLDEDDATLQNEGGADDDADGDDDFDLDESDPAGEDDEDDDPADDDDEDQDDDEDEDEDLPPSPRRARGTSGAAGAPGLTKGNVKGNVQAIKDFDLAKMIRKAVRAEVGPVVAGIQEQLDDMAEQIEEVAEVTPELKKAVGTIRNIRRIAKSIETLGGFEARLSKALPLLEGAAENTRLLKSLVARNEVETAAPQHEGVEQPQPTRRATGADAMRKGGVPVPELEPETAAPTGADELSDAERGQLSSVLRKGLSGRGYAGLPGMRQLIEQTEDGTPGRALLQTVVQAVAAYEGTGAASPADVQNTDDDA